MGLLGCNMTIISLSFSPAELLDTAKEVLRLLDLSHYADSVNL
jgi:hypothetical protein